jgi:serine/threonine protein kinase
MHSAPQSLFVGRDIKPANIIVTRDLNTIKIADFGTARRFDNPHQDVCERTGELATSQASLAKANETGFRVKSKPQKI